jgi:hypothetical protein
MSLRSILKIALCAAVVGTAALNAGNAATFAGVSIAVGNETAPQGAIAQMKFFLTEPKPISTTGGSFTLSGFDSILGISLFSPTQDTVGVAVVRGTTIGLSIVSPSASYGNTIDYPILTVAGRVPLTAPIGSSYTMGLDPATIQFLDPSGAVYPLEVAPGQLTVNTGVAIGDINPGDIYVPFAGVVAIGGRNFVPGTKIRFGSGKLLSVNYVGPERIDAVVAQTTPMRGMLVKALNPDRSTSSYYSYQRTYPMPMSGSGDPVLQLAMPLMPPTGVLSATVPIPAPAASTTYGVAVQNVELSDTVAALVLLDSAGNQLASATLPVSSDRFTIREISELFGVAPTAATSVRVTSPTPIKVIGVVANQTTGKATPIVAQ